MAALGELLYRLGEIRDRKPENKSYRTSGLTLLTAAISLWNTVCLYGKSVRCPEAQRDEEQRATAIAFVPARLGTHQSYRRLYLEKQLDTGFR